MLAPIGNINQALVRLGKKKLHALSHTVSNFLDHFHRLNGLRITIDTKDDIDMQDLRKQVSNAQNLFSQLNTNGMTDESIIEKMLIGYGRLGVSNFTAGAIMVGGMAVVGDLLAAPALAIFGALSAAKMEKKARRCQSLPLSS